MFTLAISVWSGFSGTGRAYWMETSVLGGSLSYSPAQAPVTMATTATASILKIFHIAFVLFYEVLQVHVVLVDREGVHI